MNMSDLGNEICVMPTTHTQILLAALFLPLYPLSLFSFFWIYRTCATSREGWRAKETDDLNMWEWLEKISPFFIFTFWGGVLNSPAGAPADW